MICVKFFKLPTVLTIALKLNGSFQGLQWYCYVHRQKKNLLFWSYWICQLPSIELIVLSYFQDCLPVLAFVTRHLIGFVHIYLSVHIHQNSRCLFRCACRPYLIEYLRDPCWVCIHCTPPITSPLGDDLSYHFHADDTQLYLSFETSLPEDLLTCKSAIDNCIKDIDLWMLENKLKLNSGKTEIIVFSFSCCLRPVLNNLVIASDTVDRCSTVAKNNGVIINNSLSMVPHVTAVCKSSFFHLRNF